jgi:hypothetical protein
MKETGNETIQIFQWIDHWRSKGATMISRKLGASPRLKGNFSSANRAIPEHAPSPAGTACGIASKRSDSQSFLFD